MFNSEMMDEMMFRYLLWDDNFLSTETSSTCTWFDSTETRHQRSTYEILYDLTSDPWPHVLAPPRWWRWYDIFRVWPEPVFAKRVDPYKKCAFTRGKDRSNRAQRYKEKRRRWIQSL